MTITTIMNVKKANINNDYMNVKKANIISLSS